MLPCECEREGGERGKDVSVYECVHSCVRVCMRVCVGVCVRVCVHTSMGKKWCVISKGNFLICPFLSKSKFLQLNLLFALEGQKLQELNPRKNSGL